MKNNSRPSLGSAVAAATAAAAAAAAAEEAHRLRQRSLNEGDFDEMLTAVLGCKPDPNAVLPDDLIAYDAGLLDAEKKKWVEHRLMTSMRAVHDLCLLRKAKRVMEEDADEPSASGQAELGENT